MRTILLVITPFPSDSFQVGRYLFNLCIKYYKKFLLDIFCVINIKHPVSGSTGNTNITLILNEWMNDNGMVEFNTIKYNIICVIILVGALINDLDGKKSNYESWNEG